MEHSSVSTSRRLRAPSTGIITLLRKVRDEPGITTAELARSLRWTPEHLDSVLRVLEAASVLVRQQQADREGNMHVCVRAVPPRADSAGAS